MSTRSKVDQKLDEFIGLQNDVEAEIDKLDDEDQTTQMVEVVEYDKVDSKFPAEQRDNDLYDDYEYCRTILHGLLKRGTVALENSLMLAKESQHPRAFEVTSTLMKNIADTSKDLMKLHHHMDASGTKDGGSPKTQTNIQNNYYGQQSEEKGVDDLLEDLEDEDNKNK